jgi:hypothetical protein
VASSIGSTIEGSSFSGLLTRVEIGHIRIKSEGNGRIKSRIRLLAEPAGIISRRENDRHSVMDIGYQPISIGGDDRKRADPLARTRLLPVLPNFEPDPGTVMPQLSADSAIG